MARAHAASIAARCVATAVLACACAGAAAPPPRDLGVAQFGVDRWDATEGLGSNWVRGLIEDPDGTIWIGTGTGLVRFDGRTFTPVVEGGLEALAQRAVTALARGRDGALWAGLEFDGVRCIGAACPPLPALPDGTTVNALLVDRSGALWIGTPTGLWRGDVSGATRVAPIPAANAAEIRGLALGPDGEVWARSTAHGLWRIDGAGAAPAADAPGCLGFGVAVGPDGERFISCREGVWRWPADGDAWLRIADDFGVGPIHLDRRGDLWFGGEAGLTRWSKGRLERLPPERGLGDWRVRALAEDRRGDLWLGTFSGGLARLHRGPVQTFGAPEGMDIDGTTAVLPASDGRLWIAAFRDGLFRLDPATTRVEHWSDEPVRKGRAIWSLARDPAHPRRLWLGTDDGLRCFAPEVPCDAAVPEGLPPGPVRALHADAGPPATLWLAAFPSGAVAVVDGRATVHGEAQGLRAGRLRFFHRDRAGRLLAGGELGLFAFADGHWMEVMPDGRTLPALTAIAEQGDGTLWLASSRLGLLRIESERVVAWGIDAGLPFWPLHSLSLDADGGLWMSGNEGLARLRLEDHARWAAGERSQVPVERLGRRDGLRDVETNGWGYPAHGVLDDGRLVYPSARGIALLQPADLPSVGLSPQEIRLRGAWAGTRALPLGAPLRLGRDERSLRVAFSAIELLRPEAVSFRYRLAGVDDAWIETGPSREAGWSILPPGEHRLELQARLPGQPWIDAAASVPLTVEAQPWESPTLRLAAIALAMLLAIALVNWRIRIGSRHAALLRRARAFLREVIDTSPNPIFARGRDGRYSLANRAAAEIYHLAPDALEGRTPTELGATPAGMAGIDALDAEVIAGGAERVLPEHMVVDADGRERWYRVVKRPGFGADGRTVEQVIGTAVDVTDFKLAEQRLGREQARLRRSREAARTLSHQLLRAQEDERRRLAREIHDDLTQQLAGLSMFAWSTAQATAREPAADRRGALEHLAHGLERLANDVQALSRELHPPALDALGLAEALRAECATFGQRTALPIEFQATPLPVEPPPEVGIALYRIAQEALRNALVHARASRVHVSIGAHDGGLRLRVADDGVGFDPAAAAARAGIGLRGMQERARLAGVALAIGSTPQGGTRIEADWHGAPEPAEAA